MTTNPLDAELRSRIDEFLVSISALVRQSAVESVRQALGDGAPARRGPGRPRNAAGARSAPKATPRRKAGRRKTKAKPGRRARRSGADIDKTAATVLAYVRSHPGSRLEEIGRGLRRPTAGLKRPVAKLLAEGKVRTEGQRRGTRYFVGRGAKRAAKAGRKSRRKATRKAARRAGRKAGKRGRRKAAKASKAREVARKRGGKKAGKRAGKKGARKVAKAPAAAEPATAG